MNEQTPSPEAHNIAQELGADPAVAHAMPDAIQPVSIAAALRDVTRRHPLAMLGVAFLAGAAYVGRRRRR
jgi:hypothetical protein